MLKLLIPVICPAGAPEAARHAAFLFSENCVSQVELVEVLEEMGQGRAAAFRSRAQWRRREKLIMRDALALTRAVLDDAGVPYTWKRVFGPPERTIAAYANAGRADVVVLDAGGLGRVRKWSMFVRLWRLSSKPITVLH
ncbi:UspA family protein [Caballeronia calidae]|uniref:UspA family protein n=1 Tax=Caballeronia calidae TaxID=1777139 RepID=A0A158CK35_9BURK|nr:universal stress protein [Caballeronia calidae]SAK82216.1 UspA family protein [Caballeronia calidae]